MGLAGNLSRMTLAIGLLPVFLFIGRASLQNSVVSSAAAWVLFVVWLVCSTIFTQMLVHLTSLEDRVERLERTGKPDAGPI